jgi:RHS repeat-associated protein
VVISDTEAVYLYGLDIIAQQQAERLYYVNDGLGSVRQLLDTTGQIETNYAYDPFGAPLVAGDVYNPYQYTGEAWDAEVELLYLRARYYQPEVGRFVTKDQWAGNLWQPGTLNRYVYVTNDPVNGIDRGGLDGGGPEGLGIHHDGEPESYQYDIPDVTFSWPTEPEPDILPFEEWVKEWPDPWVDEPVGWEFSDMGFDPVAFRTELFAEAKGLYAKQKPKYPIDALAMRNNPLTKEDLTLCIGSGLYQRTRANWMKPQWVYFLGQLGMDATQETNYEPYWLTFNMLLHHDELQRAQKEAYQKWYVPFADQYGTEYEEIPHTYEWGTTYD